MANILSLAMKINADASGFKLDPVQRALVGLGDQADKLTGQFDKFKGSSEAAARAQEEVASKTQDLINALRDGGSATQFAADFERLVQATNEQVAALERGAEITRRYTSEETLRAERLAELQRLLDQGAIKEEIYAAAVADVSGANAAAAEAEKQRIADLAEAERERQAVLNEGASLTQRFVNDEEGRAANLERVQRLLSQGAITEEIAARATAEFSGANAEAARVEKDLADQRQAAARIIEANLSAVEKAQQNYETSVAEVERLEKAGLLTTQQANAERQRQSGILAKVTEETKRAADAAGQQSLKFNELSGIFAALPGPLGNIAGRISGISSAGEGLSRVFSGGLSQGISSVVASLTSLVNPLTLAVAGVAAFGAAATAIVNGLSAIEDRVEKLGNTASKLGVSFGFIQTLDEAARRSGTSIEAVSAAFGRLQKSVLGVDEESKAAQKALAEIGVTAEELQALSPEEQYRLIGKAITEIEDPARRAATATALFGKQGAELTPFFNNIGKATADMQTFGSAISDFDRGRIDNLGDAFDGVFVSLQGLGQSVLLPFAGLVEGVAKAFSGLVNIATAVAQAIGAVFGPVLDAVGSAFGAFGDAVNGTIGFFRSFFTTAEDTSNATSKVQETVKESAQEVEALSKAFDSSDRALDSAIAKAGEFGQAGFDAAKQFQDAVQELKDQVADNELNAEQYSRGVANATAEYERQIESIRKVQQENKRLAEESQRRAEAEAAAVQNIIDKNLEQIRVDEQFGGDSNRARAADNLTKLLAEQVRVEEQLVAARASGDQAAINAATSRLAQLDQVAARERDIASGAAKAREDAEKAAAKAAEEAQRRAEQQAQAINRVNEQILAKQEDFNAQQFEIELERARELSTVRTGSVAIQDIREGGISAIFDTLREDPAISEARKQTSELQKISKEIAKLQAEKVDILAGAG